MESRRWFFQLDSHRLAVNSDYNISNIYTEKPLYHIKAAFVRINSLYCVLFREVVPYILPLGDENHYLGNIGCVICYLFKIIHDNNKFQRNINC